MHSALYRAAVLVSLAFQALIIAPFRANTRGQDAGRAYGPVPHLLIKERAERARAEARCRVSAGAVTAVRPKRPR